MPIDPNQIFVISSGINKDRPQTVILVPKDLCADSTPVLGVQTNDSPKWKLTPGPNSTYTIGLADTPSLQLVVGADKLITLTSKQAPSPFYIEAAGGDWGDNWYRIHVPSQNLVARLPEVGKQVDVFEANGGDNEYWFFDAWDHPSDSLKARRV